MAWKGLSFAAGVCAWMAVGLGVADSDAPALLLLLANLGTLFSGVMVWSYVGSLPSKYPRSAEREPAATSLAPDQHR